MQSLPLHQVRITDPFWARYQRLMLDVTLPHIWKQIVETGRLKNFHRAAGKAEGDFEGMWFNDSDIYKYAEACAYALATGDSKQVRAELNEAIEAVQAAQMEDGYLNTFFQVRHPDMRWRRLDIMHEMYCGGHLLEAAVAVYECLGDRRLLDVAIRFVDHVMERFGPDKKVGYCGHEEFELGLIRLARATGDDKYRDYARWMVEARGHRPSPFEPELTDEESWKMLDFRGSLLLKDGKYSGEYSQDHAPIREHTEVVGHAVRAMYLYIAAADLADGQEDKELETALVKVWESLTKRRMYVTGGIGPSAHNEGFTGDFDLPNFTSYAETCAAIGLVIWGHKMLEVTGIADYADVMERALYNAVLPGISLSGDTFFYANPHESRGNHARTPWFTCACCPPNVARLIASLGAYAAGYVDGRFYLHLPIGMEADIDVDGLPVKVVVEGQYPWDGRFSVRVVADKPVRLKLCVRLPGWADDINTELPGATEEAEFEQGYVVFDRVWRANDKLSIDLEMSPKWVESDPRVRENLGRVALTMGPIIYCAEQGDLGSAPQLASVDPEAEVHVEYRKTLLEGVNVLSVEGVVDEELFVDDLYAEVGTTRAHEATVPFVPYFAWQNRGATNMQVWVRRL